MAKYGRRSEIVKWTRPEQLVLIRSWKRNGLTNEQVAQNIGIHIATLQRWAAKNRDIREALKTGKEQANAVVENKLFTLALSGNLTAIIFWLKNNWRDKYNDSTLSVEERQLAQAKVKKTKAEADIAAAQAKAIKDQEEKQTQTVVIDDIKHLQELRRDHGNSKD